MSVSSSKHNDKQEPQQSQETVFSKECPSLLSHHFDQLHVGSGIGIEVIRERGYESVLGRKRLADLGFSKAQQRTPGLLLPLHGVDSTIVGYQYRPDHPRQDRRGRAIRYETPRGASNRVDCPPRCQKQLADPLIPLHVTEGAKKADCLASLGVCIVDIPGVWSWKSKNQFGGITISSDFDNIAFNGRQVYLVPDSDVATIPGVRQACLRLVEHLSRRKANVRIIYLPQEGTEKVGVDDFIVAGHTVEQLEVLAVPLEEVPEEEEKEKEVYASYAHYNKKLYLEVRRLDGSYAFAYLKDNEVGLVSEIVAGDLTLRPRPLPVSEGRIISFVGMPDENIVAAELLSPGQLYKEIEAHFRKYIDLPELDLQLCVYYVVFTWFYHKVNTLGYLRLRADTGKGKSRILEVVGDLCFYPVSASGASSFSGTARQQDKWRGTLKVDESDFQGDKEVQYIKYLNLGFERGKPYVLSDKQNPKRQEFFDPFSPKILAMREPFSDPATEGRMLSISPHETSNPAIPIILKSNYSQEMQTLRNKIARFTLEHWDHIDGEAMLDFHNLGIEPRLQQLAMPMSIIFQLWPDGVEQFRRYLLARQLEIRKLRAQSWQGSLFNIVYSIATGDFDLQEEFASYYQPQTKEIQAVTPSMVARQMKSSAKAVTQTLTGIGFEVERRAITIHSKDNTESEGKTRVVRCYGVPSQRAWDEMVSRYYYQEDEGESDVELPDILRSTKFMYEKESVYAEASKVSNVSIKPAPSTITEFTPTADWQEVPPGAAVPPGCEIRMDFVTGRNYARRRTEVAVDTFDRFDGSTHTEDKKGSKKSTKSSPDQSIPKILGMTIEEALDIWNKQGRPVIHLGPGENCHDLAKLLTQRGIKPEHLSAIREWLEKYKEATDGKIGSLD